MTKRIALISEHASPLCVLGGVDSGGQNRFVGQLAKQLAGLGYEVDVFTRRDSDRLPEIAEWEGGVRIIHVPAGPAEFIHKEEMLPFMDEFAAYLRHFCQCQRGSYDLVHANCWMSGLVACELKRWLGLPFVGTFHALGRVRRLHQKQADRFPDVRFEIEDRIIAEADRILDDIEAGRRAGCRTILLDNGHETEWVVNAERVPEYMAVDFAGAAKIITGNGEPGA